MPKFGRRVPRRILAAVLAAVALAAVAYLKRQQNTPSVARPGVSQNRVCVRVVDGDTIVLDGGEHVRLIGVDTPETVDPRRPVQYFGKEASAFTRRMVEGKNVRLEQDEDTRDHYGRTLAYVYLQDGTFLNAEIIRQGYGHAYTRFPFRYEQQFVQLEREARENGRGLWAPR
ncbi:MAG: thermonuclease family protein [Acidobacteriia bacterium]|nr:thermonuclease family protein [Terriglobia bacterium]